MTVLRTHIALLLIAVMTLTGHSMAIARGAPGPAGFMELCTGTGPVMVAIDENGEPTGASHICPEFSLMLQDVLGGADSTPVALSFTGTRIQQEPPQIHASFAQLTPSARGPPGLV